MPIVVISAVVRNAWSCCFGISIKANTPSSGAKVTTVNQGIVPGAVRGAPSVRKELTKLVRPTASIIGRDPIAASPTKSF